MKGGTAFLLSRREILLAGLGLITVPPSMAWATRDAFLEDAPRAFKDRMAELGRIRRRNQVGHVNIPQLYRELDGLPSQSGAVDLRMFGARQDGVSDDSEAFRKALESPAAVVRIAGGGVVRLTRPVAVDRPVAIVGTGDGTSIRYEGNGAVFEVGPRDAAVTTFLHDVRFDRLVVAGAGRGSRTPPVILAKNVRRISLTRSKITRMGGLVVRHALEGRLNLRGEGAPSSKDVDPAVLGGFSASATDDLNEDVLLIDNAIACEKYFAQALRVNFAQRVVAAYNRCRFSNISWWGGGGRATEGGSVEFLRRVRDFAIIGNEVHGSLGGVYGNNGDNVLIEDNLSEDVLDCGIDFEGCFNSVARNNISRDAGNYAFSNFFAARNVRFENNVAVQTGLGATAPARFATKPIGKPSGRVVFALRSGGFAGDGQVDVACVNNMFVFAGSENLGSVLPSHSSSLVFADNQFLNVRCDLKYFKSGRVALERNSFVFTRPSEKAEILVGLGSTMAGSESRMVGNTVLIEANMPSGTAALGAVQDAPNRTVISGNDVRVSGGAVDFGLVVQSAQSAKGAPEFVVVGNHLASIADRSVGATANVVARDNVDARGAAVGVRRL